MKKFINMKIYGQNQSMAILSFEGDFVYALYIQSKYAL